MSRNSTWFIGDWKNVGLSPRNGRVELSRLEFGGAAKAGD